MMSCSVYYERIIAAEHIRLPDSVPPCLYLMLMMIVMIRLSAAAVMFSVGLSLSFHTSPRVEEWVVDVFMMG